MLGSMRVGRGDCSVYASCYAYSQRKAMGPAWDEWIAGELERLDKTGKSSIAGLSCCYGATLLDGEVVHLAVEANGLLARSRSRQAGLACTSGADVWLTCDDDVYAPADVVADLIHAARATRGMVAAPYWLRQTEPRTAFRYRGDPRILSVEGVELCTADALHTGFGLVAMHVDVLRAVGRLVPWWHDETGGPYPAAFLEFVDDEGLWIGEDFAFCRRVHEAAQPMHLLLGAPVTHANLGCKLTARDGALFTVRFDFVEQAEAQRAAR
jgi:hypothetical protein